MSIVRDEKNPNISIINTPQGTIKFNFGIGGGIETKDFGKLALFDPIKREEAENALDAALNRPGSSPEALKLQGELNLVIIATQRGTPLDIATSSKMTPENSGGGAMLTNLKNNEAVFALNMDAAKESRYDSGKHPAPLMPVSNLIDHELFHYVDNYLNNTHKIEGNVREDRAIWTVNKIMKADGVDERINYDNPKDNDLAIGGKMNHMHTNNRLLGDLIPGLKKGPRNEDGEREEVSGFIAPTTSEHRMYPHNMQKQVQIVEANPASVTKRDVEAEKKYAEDVMGAAILRVQQIKRGEIPTPETDPQKEIVVNKIVHTLENQDRNVSQNGGPPPPSEKQAPEPDFSRH